MPNPGPLPPGIADVWGDGTAGDTRLANGSKSAGIPPCVLLPGMAKASGAIGDSGLSAAFAFDVALGIKSANGSAPGTEPNMAMGSSTLAVPAPAPSRGAPEATTNCTMARN